MEDSLVNQLFADAADEPGALPLLQETMALLWDDIEQRTLPYCAYERLSRGAQNGLAVAIAMKADATLAGLNPNQKAIARRIFLRLIQFGEGRADTRRQQPVDALRAASDEPGEFERTLDHLTDHRLLTRSGGDDDTPPAVDISHEALIDGWSRLQDWADERREAEQVRRRLESKAAEWVRLGKGTGGLLDEAELPEAERWLASDDAANLGFDATLPELIEASQQAIEAAVRAREDAREKELQQAEALAKEQRQRIEEQARAAGRMRRSMVGLAVVFFVAVGAAIFAWTQNQKAQSLAVQEASAREEAEARRAESEQARIQSEQRRVEAEKARLESIAQLLLIQAPQQQAALNDETGALMARQAFLFAPEGSRSLKAQMASVLRAVVGKPRFSPILNRDNGRALAFSPDGSKLASNTGFEIELWDLSQQGSQPTVLPGYPGSTDNWLYGLVFSADGKALIAANADGTIGRWDLDNPQAPFVELPKQKGGVWSAVFSRDGRWLVTGSKLDDTFVVWDLTRPGTGPAIVNNPQPATPGSGPHVGIDGGVPVAFSPNSATLATGSLNGTIRLWRPDDLTAPIASLDGHKDVLLALAFDEDGTRLASSGQDAKIRLWNFREPSAVPVVLEAGLAPATSLDFNADGNILASASAEGIRLWRVDKPDAPPVLIPGGFVYQAVFSPDGKRLASRGSASSHLRLWDMEPSGRPRVLTGHKGSGVLSLAFSPDGKLLASGGGTGDGTVRLWRWNDLGAPPRVLSGHKGTVNSLHFSADGTALLSASWNDNAILLWDLDQTSPKSTALPVPDHVAPWTARLSSDGKSVTATGTGGAYAWDLTNLNAEPAIVLPSKRWATELAYSPNGKALAMGNLGSVIHVKDLTRPDGAVSELLVEGGPNDAWSVVFSPDGKRLASGGKTDPAVRLWDPGAPGAASTLLGRHDEGVTRVRFSPDGKQLASASVDHTVRLWDVENPDALPIELAEHEGELWSMAYGPDGRYLVTGSRDKTIRIWDLTHPLNMSTLQQIADKVCQIVWRNLTLDEWRKFVGVELPYERTCPNLPVHPSLLEAATKLAKAQDIKAAVALFERAVELDGTLDLDPAQEAEQLAKSAAQ